MGQSSRFATVFLVGGLGLALAQLKSYRIVCGLAVPNVVARHEILVSEGIDAAMVESPGGKRVDQWVAVASPYNANSIEYYVLLGTGSSGPPSLWISFVNRLDRVYVFVAEIAPSQKSDQLVDAAKVADDYDDKTWLTVQWFFIGGLAGSILLWVLQTVSSLIRSKGLRR